MENKNMVKLFEDVLKESKDFGPEDVPGYDEFEGRFIEDEGAPESCEMCGVNGSSELGNELTLTEEEGWVCPDCFEMIYGVKP